MITCYNVIKTYDIFFGGIMKIAIICDVLGKANNGTSIAAMNLIRYMQNAGHDVRVVCCDKDKENMPGYYIVPVCDLGVVCNKILEKNGVSVAKRDEKVLREAIREVDVVQIETPFSLGLTAAKIAMEYNIPISASFHCQAENITSHIGLMNFHPVNHLIYKYFYQKLYRHCATVHYPTQFIRDVFETEVNQKTNGYVISNGVNREFFDPTEKNRSSGKFTVVCSGRYSKEKAQHIVIKAVGQSKYKDKIRLILAGEGPKKKRLMRLAKRLGVDAHFEFFNRRDLIRTLRSADLYVHTSVAEIEAISCTEAIVCGLVPVISDSKMSATKAFALDEKNLFTKNDVKDLTRAVEFWYEHPNLREAYRLQYKTKLSCFDQEDCMRRMEKMLETAAGSKL